MKKIIFKGLCNTKNPKLIYRNTGDVIGFLPICGEKYKFIAVQGFACYTVEGMFRPQIGIERKMSINIQAQNICLNFSGEILDKVTFIKNIAINERLTGSKLHFRILELLNK